MDYKHIIIVVQMITEQVRTKNVVHGRRSKVKEESFYFM